MKIFKKRQFTKKTDVFKKFESAINLIKSGQIKEKKNYK